MLRTNVVPVRYSVQAQKLLAHLSEFELEEFEAWFYGPQSPYMAIGDGHILDYIYNVKKNGN